MQSRWWLRANVILAIILCLTLNVLAAEFMAYTRVDLTKQKLYTLSEGTKAMLAENQEPIILRLVYSESQAAGFPALQSYALRIRGMLEEYVRRSHGMLTLEIIHPEPFSEEEDRAVALGMKAVPLDQAGTKLYLGVSASNSTDQLGAIGFLDPEREAWIEYDISKMLYQLAHPTKPMIGLMTNLPMLGEGGFGQPSPHGQYGSRCKRSMM